MKSEDFSVWLLAISGMSAAQRTEALTALKKAAADAASGMKTTGKRREDALGTTGVERVERQGCPHCASREIVGWGRSDGLLRYRCKACRRTFNALTKTPMAHLRKKEKWLDHAQAMIEGMSLAKTAKLCGVHPTTAFRWRHRFLRAPSDDKPRTLSGIVEADETFILESFKGRWSDLPRKARKRGGTARHPGPYQDNIPVLVARDRKGATFDAAPSPGKPTPEAPHLHINNVNAYHSRLKQWLNRFNGVATKNLPSYLGWRRALEAWGQPVDPPKWILSAIGNGPYQQITL
jgi:transposase-like protein